VSDNDCHRYLPSMELAVTVRMKALFVPSLLIPVRTTHCYYLTP
jgi:hypothetical protein